MDAFDIARAFHVLSIVVWIGGVAFVTTVVMPEIRRARSPSERVKAFERFARRFAWQARGAVLLAGFTGLYMLDQLDLWPAFAMPRFWGLWAMVGLWVVFAFVLFVAEPLFLGRWLEARAASRPASTFRAIELAHWLMLALSALTIFGAVAATP